MVEYYIGKRTYHSYALEDPADDYGTLAHPASSDYSWMGVVQTVSPSSKSDIFTMNALDNTDTRNVGDYVETFRSYGASIEFLLQHCRPLTMAWGSDTMVFLDPEYTHTFVATDTLPSFSLQFGYHHTTPHALDYVGCVVNKLDIACIKGEFVKCTMEVIAQKGADSPAGFRDYQDTIAGQKRYAPVDNKPYAYSDSDISIGGVDYCEVDSVRMTINNNLLAEPVLCSDNNMRISEPVPQLREFDASFTVRMHNDTLYDIWDTGVYISPNPTVTFERTVTDKVTFELQDAILESAITPLNIGEGIVLVELPMKVKSIGVVETNAIDTDYDTIEI